MFLFVCVVILCVCLLRKLCVTLSSYLSQQLTKEVIDEKQSVNKNKASMFLVADAFTRYVYYVLTPLLIISPQIDKVDKMLKTNELSEMRRMNEIEQRLATATTNREHNLIAKSSASKKRILTPRGSPTSRTQIEEKVSAIVWFDISCAGISHSHLIHTSYYFYRRRYTCTSL